MFDLDLVGGFKCSPKLDLGANEPYSLDGDEDAELGAVELVLAD